jgi:hypothetical protein
VVPDNGRLAHRYVEVARLELDDGRQQLVDQYSPGRHGTPGLHNQWAVICWFAGEPTQTGSGA